MTSVMGENIYIYNEDYFLSKKQDTNNTLDNKYEELKNILKEIR